MKMDLLAASIFIGVTTFTPGPNNILSGSMGAYYGYRRSFPFLLGVTSGFLVVMFFCAGLSSFMSAVLPAAEPAVRILGALYILWLAWAVYRGSEALLEHQEQTEPFEFIKGFALQFINPKGAFFGLTVYSTFLAPLHDRRWLLFLSPFALALVALTAVSSWALGGQLVRRFIDTPRHAKALGLALAGSLVYVAIDLALSAPGGLTTE